LHVCFVPFFYQRVELYTERTRAASFFGREPRKVGPAVRYGYGYTTRNLMANFFGREPRKVGPGWSCSSIRIRIRAARQYRYGNSEAGIWPRSAGLIFGFFGFFCSWNSVFLSQHFSQNSIFQPVSAKFQTRRHTHQGGV
jgi:hypothetical protein